MVGIHGPLGFTNLDQQGLLIEGFDYLPSIASTYHHEYYQAHFEKFGYEKENDWVEFRLKVSDIPEKAIKLNDIIIKRYALNVLKFNKTKELLPYSIKIFELLNLAFEELNYVSEFDKKTMTYYADKYFKILNPKFVKVVEKDNVMVGFIIALPSLSETMQRIKGKLFPFGVFHILNAMKKPKVVDLLLTGIDPKYQGMGVSALLITELQKTMLDHGVQHVETTGIFETNHKAIQHWKNYEHIQHKRRRCYKKLFTND